MDPYVVLKIGEKQYKSQPHYKGGKKPKWTESFSFQVDETLEKSMHVEIWDKDT